MHIRKKVFLILLALVPAGLYTKFYRGPFAGWVNDSLGGVAYVVFWSLAAFLVLPSRRHARPIALWVFSVTCALECLQLVSSPLLAALRGTFIGRSLLGTTFVWLDFPHYAAGALISLMVMRRLGASQNDREM